jgi:hypothetical protein
MTDYERWQLDPGYHVGIELYKHLGGNDSVLLSLFSLPETSFTRAKLEEALRDISGVSEKVEAKDQKPEPSEAKTPEPVLRLIRQRSQLHESLFHTTSKSDRHKIALTILAIGKKLDRYYDHGELPAGEVENDLPESDIPTNAWELHQLINNNLAYMAKNKNREDKQGEVKRRERMNGLIEERLKSINYNETTGQST